MITLFKTDNHQNVMFSDLTSGHMVQANQHVIVHGDEAMILDPGGHKVYSKLFSGLSDVTNVKNLKYIFFSHQDPDIIASANAWLMISKADAFLSELWMRFIPHFGVDELVISRINPIPDSGMKINLGGAELKVIPAHFLHSAGNFQVYDTVSKILYTGDLGASIGAGYDIVENFESHIQYMEGFHRRYLPCNKAIKLWVDMVRKLDIDMIVPQHGAIFNTRELVKDFIDWIEWLPCGIDLMSDSYKIPE
jgi:flavorubredoxin